jgi:hypothetical protein
MIKFDIKHRFTGAIAFTAEIDCTEDTLTSVKIGLSALWAIKTGADLRGADLRGADLRGADLYGADLRGADLYGANLRGAKSADLAIARTRILPDGELIGWKMCKHNIIVKLRIPADAKRSHAFGRKCRAEYADVLDVIGSEMAVSLHDNETEYRPGVRVTAHKWDEHWQEECSGGIHFYITREEAEAHI